MFLSLLVALLLTTGCTRNPTNRETSPIRKPLTEIEQPPRTLPKLSAVAFLSPQNDQGTLRNLIVKTTPNSTRTFERIIEGVGQSFEANPFMIAYTEPHPSFGPEHPSGPLRAFDSENQSIPVPPGLIAKQGSYFIYQQKLAYLADINLSENSGRLEIIDQDGQEIPEFTPIDEVQLHFRINEHVVSFLTEDLILDYGTLRVLNLKTNTPAIDLSIPYVKQYALLEDRIIYNAFVPESIAQPTRRTRLHAINLDGRPIEGFRAFYNSDSFTLGSQRIYCHGPNRLFLPIGTTLHILDFDGESIHANFIDRVLESISVGHRIAYLRVPERAWSQENYFSELHISDQMGLPIENFTPIRRVFTSHGLKMNSSAIAYTTTSDVFSETATLNFINHDGQPITSLPSAPVLADQFVLF